VKGFTKLIPKKPSALPGTANRTISACCQETKVQQFTSETPEQTMPESWFWVKNLESPHCREQILGVNEGAVQPWWFVAVSQRGCKRTCVEERSWKPQNLQITRSSGRWRA